MIRRIVLRVSAVAAAVAVASCTFGSLSDYEVQQCHLEFTKQSDDDCDRLNHDPSLCMPLQCDATRRCVPKARDDDRDGDPAARCGGTDCDDTDPLNFGGARAHERCDGRDNNCNNLVDEQLSYAGGTPKSLNNVGGNGASPFVTIVGTSGKSLVGTYVAALPAGGSCIAAIALGTTSTSLAQSGECAFLADAPTVSPAQPAARLLSINGPRGAAAVFSAAGSGCGVTGTLGYRWAAQNQAPGKLDMPCSVATALGGGVALPMLDQIPNGPVVVLWYGASLASRIDPLTSCTQDTAPAKLYALTLADPTAPPTAFPATPAVVSDSGIAMRPAATLTLDGLAGVLVAAPNGDDAALWVIDGTGKVTPALATVPSLANARAISLSAGPPKGSVVPIALVAEIGCQPAAIRIAFGTFDTGTKQAKLGPAVDVAAATGGFAMAPSATWLEQIKFGSEKGVRTEWMVTWLVDGPRLLARRFGRDGSSLSSAFSVADHVVLGVPGADGEMYAVADDRATFVDVPVICPPQ